MLADFKDENLRRAELELAADCGRGQAITKIFRRRMQSIRAAEDERDFMRQIFSFREVKGNRDHQRSMKLNDQWRLIIEIVGEAPKQEGLIIGNES